MARRVAVGNNKGGARKTTLVVRLAEALAKQKRRVLVVDMDPQGNASRRLGWKDDLDNPPLTTSEVIAANAVGVAAQAIQPIGWKWENAEYISLIPARFTLEDRAVEAGHTGAWRRLSKAMRGADDDFDYTLIDCPPSLGHLTQLALSASHYALATSDPEYDGVEAAVRYRDFILTNREDLGNDELKCIGYLISGYDQRVGAHQGQVDGARRLFGDQLWGVIPQRSVITNADEYAVPLSEVPDSAQARAVFELLAERLIKEVPTS